MNRPDREIYRTRWKMGFVAMVLFIATGVFMNRKFPIPQMPGYSTVILSRDITILSAYLAFDDQWRLKTSLHEVNPDFLQTIMLKEDRWFYYHPGVNPVSIGRAAFNNFFSEGKSHGASTITMQVARMLEPKERTYLSKVKEILRAFQLEWHYTKNEILELYINLLPYGGNIVGVKAASHLYFDKSPEKLSLSESVLLSIIPQNPNKFRLDGDLTELKTRRNYWLAELQEEEAYDAALINQAREEFLQPNRSSFPRNAPHWSNRLASENLAGNIVSTLNRSIQSTAEQFLAKSVKRLRNKGVSNGAVLVVDNKTLEVLAYCGSANFYDFKSQGQVDGVKAIRSPGSTLKPALYGMAFDQGQLTPGMKLPDIPTVLSGYSPQNFDFKFRGEVSVEEALRL